MVELDIQQTKDNNFILYARRNARPHFNRKGVIKNYTATELKQ